jgi:hypothetical protein
VVWSVKDSVKSSPSEGLSTEFEINVAGKVKIPFGGNRPWSSTCVVGSTPEQFWLNVAGPAGTNELFGMTALALVGANAATSTMIPAMSIVMPMRRWRLPARGFKPCSLTD